MNKDAMKIPADAPQIPSQPDGPVTLETLAARLEELFVFTHATTHWAASKALGEACAPDGVITAAIATAQADLLKDGGALYHSGGFYRRLQDTIFEELGKVGLHPPPQP